MNASMMAGQHPLLRSLGVLLLSASSGLALAQEPAGPPPPTSARTDAGGPVHELLPDIGKIGAEVAVFGGPSWNPYDVGPGIELGGYIDLPLRRVPGGKLSYEIFAGLSFARSDPFTLTDTLAYQLNLVRGQSPEQALAGPLPVTRSVETRLRVLHLSPFSLKWAFTGLDKSHVRPYLSAGADVLVTITQQDPVDGGAPLIAGVVTQAPELTARGTPTGQGNVDLAGHAAVGVEIRLSPGQSLNLEYRFTASDGTNARLHTASAALGFHW
jgi:hypothetical protein